MGWRSNGVRNQCCSLKRVLNFLTQISQITLIGADFLDGSSAPSVIHTFFICGNLRNQRNPR